MYVPTGGVDYRYFFFAALGEFWGLVGVGGIGMTIMIARDFAWILFICLFYGMAGCRRWALPAYLLTGLFWWRHWQAFYSLYRSF